MAKRHLNAGKPNGKARWPNRPAAYFGKIARELEAMQRSGAVVTRDSNTLRRLFSQLFTRGDGDAVNRSL
jgi:hypothetical protein